MASPIRAEEGKARRAELAAFLRSRRERVTPADVGLPPGPRRRTPGLRREELAQLAGVGVSWYTWLEQGRPINASVQVLDAIAAVLRLGPTERGHLYRLAEVPGVPAPGPTRSVSPELLAVLDALDPTPAGVYDGKFDLLAGNAAYAALFPGLVEAEGIERNVLWRLYLGPSGPTLTDPDIRASMVALVRTNYANHIGEPAWTGLIETLCAGSDGFAKLWAAHPVAELGKPMSKAFDIVGGGTVRVRATAFPLSTHECRMVVYLPETAADVALIDELRSRTARRLRPA